MAHHRSKQDETQAKTRALKESPRGAFGRMLSVSLLRAVMGGAGGDPLPDLQIPPPPPPTAG